MRILTGYQKPITALAVSPDGTRLYSAALDQQMIWVWDLASGEVEKKLRGAHRGGVGALACSVDGKWLLSAEEYAGVVVWSLPGGEGRDLNTNTYHEFTSPRPAVAVHPDSRLGAFPFESNQSRDGRYGVQLWDLASGKRRKLIKGHDKALSAVAFSPSGERLATGSSDRTVKLWDHESGKETQSLKQKAVPSRLAFRPDGKVLAVSGAKNVLVWDLASGKLLKTLAGHAGLVTGLGYSPDGRHLASVAADGVAMLYDAATHELLGQRHLDIGELGALAWLPDSSGLAAGGVKLIALCEVGELLGTEQAKKKEKGEPLSLAGHERKVVGLSYAPDARSLASWDRDQVRIWDLSGGAGQAKEKVAFKPKPYGSPRRLSWSPDGKRMARYGGDNQDIADAQTGKKVRSIPARDSTLTYLAYTPSGRLFLAFGGATALERWYRLEIRDEGGKEARSSVRGEAESVYAGVSHAALVCPDDARVYFALEEDGVFRWTTATGEVAHLFRQDTRIDGLAVTPDEQFAVTRAGNTVRVWALPEGKKKLELKHPLAASGLAVLPGGRLITSCYDGIVRLWDLSGGSELFALDLGMGKIYSFAVAPDHMTFAAGVEKDSRIVLMDVPE